MYGLDCEWVMVEQVKQTWRVTELVLRLEVEWVTVAELMLGLVVVVLLEVVMPLVVLM